jgi:hypothetical protein
VELEGLGRHERARSYGGHADQDFRTDGINPIPKLTVWAEGGVVPDPCPLGRRAPVNKGHDRWLRAGHGLNDGQATPASGADIRCGLGTLQSEYVSALSDKVIQAGCYPPAYKLSPGRRQTSRPVRRSIAESGSSSTLHSTLSRRYARRHGQSHRLQALAILGLHPIDLDHAVARGQGRRPRRLPLSDGPACPVHPVPGSSVVRCYQPQARPGDRGLPQTHSVRSTVRTS